MYQFYISEKKDAVISAKQNYKKDEIPAATQLFTPHWIVKYIVQNTLGRMWLEAKPQSRLKQFMEYYVEPDNIHTPPNRKIDSPKEIRFLDPASGSAHILVYAFELFTHIYEEEGFNKSDIPKLILENNLFGLEIDERAASLGNFALTMKAAALHKRYLRSPVLPKIHVFEDTTDFVPFEESTTLGSLLRVGRNDYERMKVDHNSVFSEKQQRNKDIAAILVEAFDCVVTNPPYLNASYMNRTLSEYVKAHYPNTKTDLFACFFVRCREFAKPNGMVGFVTPFVWMFIKSYDYMRSTLIRKTTIHTLVRPSYTAFFESAIVPLCAFTFRNEKIPETLSTFYDLDYLGNAADQVPRLLDAIKNPDSKRRHMICCDKFLKIPGAPFAYWASNKIFELFDNGQSLTTYGADVTGSQNKTADNSRFLRFTWEVAVLKIGKDKKWVCYAKGGDFRKWYGNLDYIVDWSEEARTYYKTNPTSNLLDKKYWYRRGFTFTELTTKSFNARLLLEDMIFDMSGPGILVADDFKRNYLLALFNSNLSTLIFSILNPTFHFKINDLTRFPVLSPEDPEVIETINRTTSDLLFISQTEWDSHETSLQFKTNELIKHRNTKDIFVSFDEYCKYWSIQFNAFVENEKRSSCTILEIYDLVNENIPIPDSKDTTILGNEITYGDDNRLIFKRDEILRQFISYAVGCMFGRFALDVDGIILANQGESIQDYLNILPNSTFLPDDDNIIPVQDDEYFTDDIVGRYKEFLRVAFGTEKYEENLAFVEEAIGKEIRKYFMNDFYKDHIKRYKKRPIYWMFSSPKRSFNVLVYVHRYRSDTVSTILNDYLRVFIGKLETKKASLNTITVSESASAREKTRATKDIDTIESKLKELKAYEKTLYDYAARKIEIDLDDGVKVNYLKFKEILAPIPGLDKDEE